MHSAIEANGEILEQDQWEAISASHLNTARRFTDGPRHRRDRGERHPVEDFLFEYYPYAFSLIEQWHPGVGLSLRYKNLETLPPQFTGKRYRRENGICFLDLAKVTDKERSRLEWIASLLRATQSHIPNFACHGMHEWAMVYRAEEIRHSSIAPLRLPQEEIDALIESRSITCTHHDAFRFFATDARPLNRIQPTLDTRHENEQPGCVHANMDLYKWAAKSMPWIGSSLLIEAFALATQLRDLDMRASPYDLSEWGVIPMKIETTDGRRDYEAQQRRLAGFTNELRTRLIEAIEGICLVR